MESLVVKNRQVPDVSMDCYLPTKALGDYLKKYRPRYHPSRGQYHPRGRKRDLLVQT